MMMEIELLPIIASAFWGEIPAATIFAHPEEVPEGALVVAWPNQSYEGLGYQYMMAVPETYVAGRYPAQCCKYWTNLGGPGFHGQCFPPHEYVGYIPATSS